ncbi:MAG: alpha-hydroxy-acid oxidizing protein, partial [Bacteroidota bacterium]
TIISSGGIASGLDCATSIALGADMTAAARPMLKALKTGGKKGLSALITQWKLECTGAMFLIGVPTMKQLQRTEALRQRP